MPRPTECACYICIARSLTPVKSLELVSEGKALFPNKALARRALAIDPPIGYDIELYDPSDDMQSALFALASLIADVQSQAQKTSIVQHLFFSENKKDWNLIYPWLDFFADVCLENMASTCKSFELQDRVLYIFPLLFLGPLYGHLRHPSLVRETLLLLQSTPRIMKNIFHAWSFASDSAHQTLILHSQTLLLFSDAANAIKITTSDNVNMSLFTDAFFTLPSGPILPFMSFLDQHVSQLMPGILFRVIEVLVTSLKSIVCDLDLQCFLDAGALRSLINALQRLSTPKRRRCVSQYDQEFYFISVARMHSLIVLLIYQKGVPALAEALDLGWLKTIYQTAYFIERERQVVRMEKPYFGGPLSEYLANMVTFFSVPSLMQYCVKFTNAMLSHRPDAFEFPGAPKFEAVWKALIERVNQMDSLRRAYKIDTVICAHGKCITTLEQDRFIRVCSRCQSRIYCSYACQNADWKAGHRETCSSNQMYERVTSPLSPFGNNYDTGFYSYAAKQILHKHCRSILKCLFIYYKHRMPQHLPNGENNVKNKHRNVLLILRFFGETQEGHTCSGNECYDSHDHIDVPDRTYGFGSAQDLDVTWHFRPLTNAPKDFVTPLTEDPLQELYDDQVLFFARFPHYHLSGVFDLSRT